ncbi:MAG: C4-dicarboxylate ABC transporter [Thermoanaerobacteraceae bacterium]|nr:C4-dicarboxylate ABC transporter [Thermoanaerobacteraceae bacterium]
MSTAALLSLVALIIVVIVSCLREEWNPGLLAVGAALIVGAGWGGLKGAEILKMWPTSLFMILLGVTFLFGMAQENGTLEKLTAYAVRLARGNTALIPWIIFIIVVIITTIGPGNIATTAMIAPLAMAIAGRIGMSAFLMTLLVVGAANAAAFSPFAPTGIISMGLINKMAPQLGINPGDVLGIEWKVYFNSVIAQGITNVGGFLLLGGLGWMRRQRGSSLNIDEIAPRPEPFTREQWITLGGIIAFLLLVLLPGFPAVKAVLPTWALNMLSDVGAIAFIISTVLILCNVASVRESVKRVPWFVLILVCGVTVLVEVMDKTGGLKVLVDMIGAISTPLTVHFWVALIDGILSAYSSSSGVVMPMFLPLVPGLIEKLGLMGLPETVDHAVALISSINVGSHLVDTSPLSTLGALCIACAGEHENKARLFRNLLIWGLSMSLVGGVMCLLFFGILGL